jgi:hypothetical protein
MQWIKKKEVMEGTARAYFAGNLTPTSISLILHLYIRIAPLPLLFRDSPPPQLHPDTIT